MRSISSRLRPLPERKIKFSTQIRSKDEVLWLAHNCKRHEILKPSMGPIFPRRASRVPRYPYHRLDERPQRIFHLSGKCHLFYQYHPYSNEWGPMHWGHLNTEDFIHWGGCLPPWPRPALRRRRMLFWRRSKSCLTRRHLLMIHRSSAGRDEDGFLRDVRRSAWPSVMASTMKNIPLNPVLTKKRSA